MIEFTQRKVVIEKVAERLVVVRSAFDREHEGVDVRFTMQV